MDAQEQSEIDLILMFREMTDKQRQMLFEYLHNIKLNVDSGCTK